MQLAVDMHETFERVSLSLHGSFMPHAAIYKIKQSILVDRRGRRRGGTRHFPARNAKRRDQAQGPQHWRHQPHHDSRGRVAAWTAQERGAAGAPYSCSKSSNDSNHHLEEGGHFNQFAARQARRARHHSGRTAVRRTEKTFGSTGTGRSKPERSGVKLQQTSQEMSPRDDSVLLALTRMIKKPGQ